MKSRRTKSIGRVEQNPAYVPANKQAAMSLAKGEHFDEKLYVDVFDAPPQMRPIPKTSPIDLTGVRVGRLVVVGLLAERARSTQVKNQRTARWVMRCDCGKYTIRKTRAIRAPKSEEGLRCRCCGRLGSIRWRSRQVP